jgi:hypothetical protein
MIKNMGESISFIWIKKKGKNFLPFERRILMVEGGVLYNINTKVKE